MKVVTLARLRKLGACPDALIEFNATFGKQARITPLNLKKVESAGLNTAWLAGALRLIPSHEDTDVRGNCKGCLALDTLKIPEDVRAQRALLRAARG